MTTEQKLKALFQYANEQGWKGDIPQYYGVLGQWFTHDGDGGFVVPSMLEIILSHDFARALFGEDVIYIHGGIKKVKAHSGPNHESFIGWENHGSGVSSYQFHLQQAVVLPTNKEKIDYMYKVVFGKEK